MDPDELIERFPRVFHVTEAGAWASIRHHGLLSTSALRDLFEVEDPLRSRIETQPRPDSVVLEHPAAGRAVIRDNRPLRLDVLGRCLDGTVADWCRLLNARVFFWASERRLHSPPAGAASLTAVQSGYSSLRQARGSSGCAFGVRSSRKL
jgi:hypothetical protein